jgi:hypothetical protein
LEKQIKKPITLDNKGALLSLPKRFVFEAKYLIICGSSMKIQWIVNLDYENETTINQNRE